MNKAQEKYNQWVKQTPSSTQDVYCGGEIYNSERYFFSAYALQSIIEIGCGTGNRTFPYYEERNLIYFGIEKFSHLIKSSINPSKIIHGDIAHPNFQQLEFFTNNKFDLAVLPGGVANAFIDEEERRVAWENIAFLASGIVDFVLVDTLSHFSWFKNREHGEVVSLYPFLPPQYFYAEKELLLIFSTLELEIVEEREEAMGGFARKHYLLKRKPIPTMDYSSDKHQQAPQFSRMPPTPAMMDAVKHDQHNQLHLICHAMASLGSYYTMLLQHLGFSDYQINDFAQKVRSSYQCGALSDGAQRNYSVTIMPVFDSTRGTQQEFINQCVKDIPEAQEKYFKSPQLHLVLHQDAFPDPIYFLTAWRAMIQTLHTPRPHASWEVE